jgi:hypothetical protein
MNSEFSFLLSFLLSSYSQLSGRTNLYILNKDALVFFLLQIILSQRWWKLACAGSLVSESALLFVCKSGAGLEETALLVRGRVLSVTYLGEAGHWHACSCSRCGKNRTVDYTLWCLLQIHAITALMETCMCRELGFRVCAAVRSKSGDGCDLPGRSRASTCIFLLALW